MHAAGTLEGITQTLDGHYIISFDIGTDAASAHELNNLKDKTLIIDAKKQTNKRSLKANAYFWVLCDKIAAKLGTRKECIYYLQLSRYGSFVDIDCVQEAVPILSESFRYVQPLNEYPEDHERIVARCYYGQSLYTKEEMQRLIDGTVQDAKEIGVDTCTPDEIAAAIAAWETERGECVWK